MQVRNVGVACQARRQGRALRWVLLLSAASLLSAGAAHAQSTSGSAAASQSSDVTNVGEVVITARRKEEQLRDVPIAASVVTGASIAAAGGISDASGVLDSVPGSRYNNIATPLLSEVSVRASGTGRATNADSAVGLFADGVFVAGGLQYGRNFALIDYLDLDQALVLRGSQGGLYGRNAVEGVIDLQTVRPRFKDEGSIQVGYQPQTQQTTETIVINHPLNEFVAVRLAVEPIQQSKGFVYQPDFNNYVDATDGVMGKAQIRLAKDKFDGDLMLEYQRIDIPNAWYNLNINPGASPAFAAGYVGPKYLMQFNELQKANQNIVGATLNLTYDFGWATLASVTGYRARYSDTNADADAFDATSFAFAKSLGNTLAGTDINKTQNVSDKTDTFDQDLHLSGHVSTNLDWVAGVEYFRLTSDDMLVQLKTPAGTPGTPAFINSFGTQSPSSLTYRSQAAYLSLNYKVTDDFSVSGDARYTDDRKEISELLQFANTANLQVPPIHNALASDNLSWNVTAAYKIPGSWGDLIYAKAGSGYRAGGVNTYLGSPLAPNPVTPSYQPETTLTYEVGLKGNVTKYVYVTLDAYTLRTANALASVSNGCTAVNACQQASTNFVENSGTATGSGLEANLNTVLHPLDGVLTLAMNASTQTSKYIDGVNAGGKVAQEPRYLAGMTANYRHALPITDVEGFVNVTYNGQWGGIQDTVLKGGPAPIPLFDFQLLNVRAGVNYKNYEIAAYANNATNFTYPLLFALNSLERFSLPRVYGVQLSYKW
jgi:iron complex outermembrane receptor protein